MDISTRLLKMRRRIASFSLGMLVASLLVTAAAQAQTFTDVQPGDYFYNAVEQGVSEGWINSSFSEFNPADFANRYEAAMVIYKAFGYDANPYTPANPSFNDGGYNPSHWAYAAVETLVQAGVISGYNNTEGQPTGFFGGGDNVTRIQYAKMVKKGAPLTTVIMDSAPNFPDLAVSHPLYEDGESAYAWSVINGYPDGTFKPDNNINRAEIAVMTARALAPVLRAGAGFDVDDASATALNMVEVCFSAEVGDGAEDAANYMITEDADATVELDVMSVAMSSDPKCVTLTTDAQTAGKNYNLTVTDVMSSTGEELMANADPVTFTGYKAGTPGGPLTCAPGTQPTGVAVPKGATGVNFVVVDCTAGADDVVVSSMTFHRFGAGDESDLENVYLYADDYRATTGRSVNSETQMVEFNGLNYEIPAGETVSFWVAVDISTGADAAAQHGFELMNADAIESNASSMNLSSSVQGDLFTISGATAGTVTITKNGSLDEVTIGETARIAQFELEANGTESMELEKIALYVRGTCDSSDVMDFSLHVEGSSEVLATADEVGAKDLVTFVLENPFVIEQGQNKIFYVEAQNACRNNETIKTYLDETTDLHVVGGTFQTGVQVGNDYDGSGSQFSLVTVIGSDFNIAFNGPDAGDIAIGQDSAVCMNFTITNAAGTSVDIKDWDVKLDIINAPTAAGGLADSSGATTSANYTLIKMVRINDDGSIGGSLLGPSELNTAGGFDDGLQTVTLDGTQTIDPGEVINAAIVFDVASNSAMDDDQIKCTLVNVSTAGADYVNIDNDELGAESITPSTDIVGNTMVISDSGLTFEVASTPSSRTLVAGSTNTTLLGLTVRSGSSLANTIKSITLQGYVDCDTAGTAFSGTGTTTVATHCNGTDATNTSLKDVVNTLGLYNGATLVSKIGGENIGIDGKVVFNNLSILVPKSTTMNLTLKGNIGSSAPFGTVNDRIAFSIDNQSDIVAIDSNGQNVDTGSIQIANALNNGTNANDVIMTISAGGSGTVQEQGSASRKIMVGNSPDTELARFKFTFDAEDASLRRITLGVLNANGSSIQYVKLFTGANCATPVPVLNGGAVGQEYGATGSIFKIENLNLPILDAGDTLLCVYGKTPSVTASGNPVSGDNVGIVLLDIPQVIGGSGNNISPKLIGTALSVTGTATNLDTALTAVATDRNLDLNNDPSEIAAGDVVVIDQEQILIGTDVAGDYSNVVRGFANTTIAAHAIDALVYESTLASRNTTVAAIPADETDTCYQLTSVANISIGDVLAINLLGIATPGYIEYDLVTKVVDTTISTTGTCQDSGTDNIEVVRGLFGSEASANMANADVVTEITERGNMLPLRASKPVFSAPNQVAGTTGGIGTYTLFRFNVAAQGENDVTFKKGNGDDYAVGVDDLLQVKLSSTLDAGEIQVCNLNDVTNSVVLDSIDLTGVNVDGVTGDSIDIDFNFSSNELVIESGTSATLEIDCAVTLVGASGESITVKIDKVVNGSNIDVGDGDNAADDNTAISNVVYSDGEVTTVSESPTIIDGLTTAINGNALSATP